MAAAAGMVMLVMSANVGDADPSHQPRKRRRVPRPQHQMPVVGHEAPGQQIDPIALEPLGQDANEGQIITVLVKQPPLAIAAIQHVIEGPGRDVSPRAWHGAGD